MSYWVEDLKAYLTEEELQAYNELKEELQAQKKQKLKKQLIQQYKDQFKDLADKYGVTLK